MLGSPHLHNAWVIQFPTYSDLVTSFYSEPCFGIEPQTRNMLCVDIKACCLGLFGAVWG